MRTALVWLRQDLRLADNPALHHAVAEHDAVVPVFIWAPDEAGDWPPGSAHRWWLHHALQSLDDDLQQKQSRLILRRGPSLEALRALAATTGATAVYWNERYEPALRRRDRAVAEALREDGIHGSAFDGHLLHDPERVRTTSGGPYQVYTPFWRKLQAVLEIPMPLPVPTLGASRSPTTWPEALPLEALELLPTVDWAGGLRDSWTPGEAGAHHRLQQLLEATLLDYDEQRNRPDCHGTSMLSPHLHHGEISLRQLWTAVTGWVGDGVMRDAAEAFLSQIAWREFSYHLLYHFPETPTTSLKDKFRAFSWRHAPAQLERWQKGQTGYPLVDAGMRQLWHIGWMHNRVRMVVASFLTKDLRIYWQDGARWFWDTLVDGDLANNTMGWQWSAGCGADAQPFFRIFNPVSQGRRYDPDGAYVRRWVPELAALPNRFLHRPWEAPADVLHEAGVLLDRDYPSPIVDHAAAREEALAAYQDVR